MATNLALYDYGDEDYIDMEISSSPKSGDFEFQMSFTPSKLEATADELFYKGKLLPLNLPPRRQMLQNLFLATGGGFEDNHNYYSVHCTDTTNAPLSCELTPDDFFFEWSTEISSYIKNHPTKKPWSYKLKLIKHSVQKLKASRGYLKSLFSKAVCNPDADQNKKKNIVEDNVQTRSFCGAINRHCETKCLSSSSSNSSSGASSSSSSFSFNSSGVNELNFPTRSRSETEIEVSVDAAIAHCKNSQQNFCTRNLTKSPERRRRGI
ncbi:hypothetical protein CDL12_26792 [Handroanthus impetiginosus]|uniref:Membrane-associated kinase regulator 4 n=1 Tax=Handroanthus impetiginosus TaxID=429701 RepID=A0A2G9G5W6_9LAMI|nr:hypothetical protein CDL12_26792 [Handroanthus impetiginosus]